MLTVVYTNSSERAGRSSDNAQRLYLGIARFESQLQSPCIQTEILCGFPQSFQAKTGLLPQLPPFNSFFIQDSSLAVEYSEWQCRIPDLVNW
jgi:hypothetical protein